MPCKALAHTHKYLLREPSRPCDVMVSYLGTPAVATFEIEGSAVGKYVISGKCRHSPKAEYMY